MHNKNVIQITRITEMSGSYRTFNISCEDLTKIISELKLSYEQRYYGEYKHGIKTCFIDCSYGRLKSVKADSEIEIDESVIKLISKYHQAYNKLHILCEEINKSLEAEYNLKYKE